MVGTVIVETWGQPQAVRGPDAGLGVFITRALAD
jgi:hypothetical protein